MNDVTAPGAHVSDYPIVGASELASLMRLYDWSTTPLGQPEHWPPALKIAVRIMLASRQPIWIGWGPELTYLYNDPYKSIIGGKHPWALGKPTSQVWREIWPEISTSLDTAMQGDTGTYVEEQLLIMERNGYPEETYYTYSYSPIPTEDGTAGGIICANTDDTQRVIGERQVALLRELASRTGEARTWQQACMLSAQALATNPRDITFAALYVVEPGGDTAALASVIGTPLGHPALPASLALSDSSRWPVGEVIRDHRPKAVTDLARVFADAAPAGAWARPSATAVLLPIVSSGEAGRTGVLIAGLSPFRLYDDNYAGFLDLAARQIAAAIANAEAYEQEKRRAEALAEIDRAKTAFFSNVSHEFRTPLTLMLGPLEEILAKPEGEAPPSSRRLVSTAHRNGVRLLKMVNALLDYSRLETGKAQARYEPTDLAAFTAELASTFRSAIDRAGLSLRVDAPPLPRPVHVDRDMWEKVVLNLLSNALKFTFGGEIAVEIAASADGTCAELSVRDTGTGIPAAELPHLFERFHRVEGARSRSIEGSGIGLALVQELVKLHGGSVGVESTVGQGSTFTVRLPFGVEHLPADHLRAAAEMKPPSPVRAEAYVQEAVSWLQGDDQAIEMSGASGAQDLTPTASEGQGRLVLLADDNADMRHYLERLLEQAGYRVMAVADGRAALEAARADHPDLILSDVMMPELDGFALLGAVREDAGLRDTPVILLSARAGEEAQVEGLRAGADDYLVKPFSARELLARIETNLNIARTRRETARLLQEETQVLELLNNVGTAVAREIDLERAVQVVTDAATRLSGAAFGAFFYNVVDEKGESYTLYTLSGAPREAFANFAMPRNTAVFAPTFTGEGTVRSDDIRKDPRFGKNAPYYGHPKGHLPVASYLATSVVSPNGEVLGGLFFGHPGVGVFDARAERIVEAIAVQGAIAIDKARLYRAAQEEIERRRKVEEALRENEQTLEAKVVERTAELANTNAQLIGEAAQRAQAEGRFQLLVEGVTDYAVFMLDPNGIVTNWNAGAQRIKGYKASEIVGRHFEAFYTPEDRADGVPRRALETARREGKFEAEGLRRRKDGSTFWASVVINRIHDSAGDLVGFAKITRDITERRRGQEALQRAQEQLAQAQKMEGIGQLTGGVAHDFNNLLTIIIGNLESLQRALVTGGELDADRLARSVDYAMRGAERAASLTQRLLAFSRRQPLDPKPTDVGRLVTGMSELLRRSLGEQIAIETVLTGGLWRVMVDANQLEVSILNLAVNARDAMPNGGKLTIETANAVLDETYAALQSEVVPGQYVVISITDTGIGMSREVQARALEPFYTTKDIGHGTGLGLSQVYGFVKQSGGHLKLYSEEGMGTTVKLYLPRLLAEDNAAVEPSTHSHAPSSRDGETILVVEDDQDVRAYSTGILRELGYTVLEAPVAAAGLQLLEKHPEIRLLFTDVGLPGGMNGRQLADAARQFRPDLRVLFTTGYARNAIVHDGRLDPGVALITKPFTYAALAARLDDMLDAHAAPPRVLLVEDEILVQMVSAEQLRELGYRVETAGSATEAMNKVKLLNDVAAAIVDIGLPDRKGDVLVGELRALLPRLPIVIATGYDSAELARRFAADRNVALVRKPYTQDALRSVLDRLLPR